jgi:hypothetical protein
LSERCGESPCISKTDENCIDQGVGLGMAPDESGEAADA